MEKTKKQTVEVSKDTVTTQPKKTYRHPFEVEGDILTKINDPKLKTKLMAKIEEELKKDEDENSQDTDLIMGDITYSVAAVHSVKLRMEFASKLQSLMKKYGVVKVDAYWDALEIARLYQLKKLK